MLKLKFTHFLPLAISLSIVTTSAEKNDITDVDDISKLEGLPLLIESDLSCKVICAFKTAPGEVYYVKIDSKYYAAPLKSEGVSQAIPIRKSRNLILYQKVLVKEENSDETKETYQPVLNSQLIGSEKNYMLILFKDKKGTLSSRTQNLSRTKLPANKVHLFNYTHLTLGVEIGDDKYIAKKQQLITHNCKTVGRNNYASAKVITRHNGENQTMASKRLRLIPGRRVIFVCLVSPERAKLGSTPLNMITIQDKP